MPKKKRKNQSDKGKLVKGYIPPISIGFLEFDMFRKEIKDMLKSNSGIYVLYHDKHIYYVGLTHDLYGRLISHTKHKHKNKWNKFSVFIVGRGSYLKDMETMVHRISEPSANVFKGKFKEHYQYDRRIKKLVSEISSTVKKIKSSE